MTQNNSVFLFTLSLLFQLLFVKCQKPLAPALYIFGDSIADSGNNNYINAIVKANYKPYGIDFPADGPTGRLTNGKTIMDFIAEELGLPMAPPYLGLSNDKNKSVTGVNYASAAAGILPETGKFYGNILHLDAQINNFEETVTKDLPKHFKTKDKVSLHMENSIVTIMIGSNDYIVNYLDHEKYDTYRTHTPDKFATLLVDRLKERLMKLYDLGARKIVLFGLLPIGCQPATVNRNIPKPTTPCNETINSYVVTFNDQMGSMLKELDVILPQSTFVFVDIYAMGYDIIMNPLKYGFTGESNPCCVLHEVGLCLPNTTPCTNRNTHIFWDAFHPSEALYKIIADACFSVVGTCVPMNIQMLALKESSSDNHILASVVHRTHSKDEL